MSEKTTLEGIPSVIAETSALPDLPQLDINRFTDVIDVIHQRIDNMENSKRKKIPSGENEAFRILDTLEKNKSLLVDSLTVPPYYVLTANMLTRLLNPRADDLNIGMGVPEFAAAFLIENADKVLKILPSLDGDNVEILLIGAVERLDYIGGEEQKKQACDFVRRSILELFRQGKGFANVVNTVKAAMKIADSEQIKGFLKSAGQLISSGSELNEESDYQEVLNSERSKELAGRILRGMTYFDNEDEQDVRVGTIPEKVSRLLEFFGLPVEKAVSAWNSSRSELSVGDHYMLKIWEYNLRELISLEVSQPGITSYLYSNFGILDFDRYPREILLDQYENRNNSETPYGVVLYPYNDHNGAFYNRQPLNGLHSDLRKIGLNLRVYECADKLSVISALNRARHAYGKISFAVIGGHGTEHSIQFGQGNSRNNLLSSEDILRSGASTVTQAFIDDPTIILVSCSTGAEKGIGQEISDLGATVIAPNMPTTLKDISVVGHSGKLQFTAEYSQDEHLARYSQGQKVSETNE